MYNPFQGAQIYLYPKDRDIRNPRIYDLQTEARGESVRAYAVALNGRIVVVVDEFRNIQVKVNGKLTERYSIKYAGKAQRKVFGST